jgi:hypothetical protein
MTLSNRDRLGKALDQLRDGLLPYISRQLEDNIGPSWQDRLPPQGNNLQDIDRNLDTAVCLCPTTAWLNDWPELEQQASAASTAQFATVHSDLI